MTGHSGKQMADHQSYKDERLKNHTKAVNALVFERGRYTAHALRHSASTLMSQFGISDASEENIAILTSM